MKREKEEMEYSITVLELHVKFKKNNKSNEWA